MFTQFQLGIIHAVSTVLFQEGELDYWTRNDEELTSHRSCEIFAEDECSYQYNLFVKVIDNEYYLAVEAVSHNDYGEVCYQSILGYILINNERKCWEMDVYCYTIETLIKRRPSIKDES